MQKILLIPVVIFILISPIYCTDSIPDTSNAISNNVMISAEIDDNGIVFSRYGREIAVWKMAEPVSVKISGANPLTVVYSKGVFAKSGETINGPVKMTRGSDMAVFEFRDNAVVDSTVTWLNAGKPFMEMDYKGGRIDGEIRNFNADGILIEAENYSKGLKSGEDIEYYTDGDPERISSYLYGRQYGPSRLYSRGGELVKLRFYNDEEIVMGGPATFSFSVYGERHCLLLPGTDRSGGNKDDIYTLELPSPPGKKWFGDLTGEEREKYKRPGKWNTVGGDKWAEFSNSKSDMIIRTITGNSEAFFLNGAMIASLDDASGTWTGNPVNGKIYTYYVPGELSEDAWYKNGLREGKTKKYYDTRLYREETYKAGVKDGPFKVYEAVTPWEKTDDSGQLSYVYWARAAGVYKNGKIDGTFERFWANGNDYLEVNYTDGKPDPTVHFYGDSAGREETEITQFDLPEFDMEMCFYQFQLRDQMPNEYKILLNGKSKVTGRDSFLGLNTTEYDCSYGNCTSTSRILYFNSGKIRSYEYRENGQYTGKGAYNEDGTLVWKEDYENGLVTVSKNYNKGNISEVWDRKNKIYECYDETGRVIKSGGDKQNGLIKTFNSAGKVIEEENLKNGALEGRYAAYYDDGSKKEEGTYSSGAREGQYSSYYKGADLKSGENYVKGMLDGYFTDYYLNGKKKQEGYYKNGSLFGNVKAYDENGDFIKETAVREPFPQENAAIFSITAGPAATPYIQNNPPAYPVKKIKKAKHVKRAAAADAAPTPQPSPVQIPPQ
jgi:antitoxin component YwqK of YwqJK toxin-antitoxin module